MTQLTPGQIYVADQRGIFENSQQRRFSTFNYSGYYNEHRIPRSGLRVFNEWYLAPEAKVELAIDHTGYLVLLPITGGLLCQVNGGGAASINVDEVSIQYVSAGDRFSLINPDTKESLCFFHIELTALVGAEIGSVSKVSFDLERSPNRLVPLIFHDDPSVKLQIGFFGGREETMYELSNEHSSMFAFVINGAFEMQGRLLHKGDGLALWDTKEADIEALSENAVLLIIESN